MSKRIGLIGCGRIAAVHVEAIKALEGLQLAAVCDIDQDRLRLFETEHKVKGYRDHKDLLGEDLDLIVIATPNGTHFPIAKDCLSAGRDILMEKPVTIRNEEAEELVALAKSKKCRFFAVKQVRYNPSVRALKSAVDQERIGRVYGSSLVVRWTRPQEYFDESPWRGTKELDGGSLLNQGIHYVDIMQWLMGDVASVFGRVARCCHKIEIEDMAFGLVHFKSGALGTIEFGINTYPHNLECSLTVLGEKGSVKLSGSAMNEVELWMVKDMPHPVLPKGFEPYVYEGGLYQGSCPNHIYVYRDIVRVFAGANQSYVDGSEALRSLRIVNALYKSSETGKEVALS